MTDRRFRDRGLLAANGWTGGQYSLYRACFGLYLAVHFATLLPYGPELFSSMGMVARAEASPFFPAFPNLWFVLDQPIFVTLTLGLATLASLAFAAGYRDRIAAGLLWYVLACTYTRNPLIANPSLPYIGWLLLAHAALQKRPYGAWDTKGRDDPAGDFHLPRPLFAAAWILMAVGYSYSGYTKLVSPSWLDGSALAYVLDNPLARPTMLREFLLSLPDGLLRLATWSALTAELAFLPLALWWRARPFLWITLLLMHLGLTVLVDFSDLSAGMVLLHLATFDPRWLPARRTERARLFYDGDCGLCHRAVRFILAEDPAGMQFVFTALESPAATELLPRDPSEALPDSLIVREPEGEFLFRSAAVIAVLDRVGGLWRVVAWCVAWVPAPILDALYDQIAAVRRKIFASPSDACPVADARLRARFDEDLEES